MSWFYSSVVDWILIDFWIWLILIGVTLKYECDCNVGEIIQTESDQKPCFNTAVCNVPVNLDV